MRSQLILILFSCLTCVSVAVFWNCESKLRDCRCNSVVVNCHDSDIVSMPNLNTSSVSQLRFSGSSLNRIHCFRLPRVVRLLDVRSTDLSEEQICSIKNCPKIEGATFLHDYPRLKCFKITIEAITTTTETVPPTEDYLTKGAFGTWAGISLTAWIVGLTCSLVTVIGICKKIRQLDAQIRGLIENAQNNIIQLPQEIQDQNNREEAVAVLGSVPDTSEQENGNDNESIEMLPQSSHPIIIPVDQVDIRRADRFYHVKTV